MSTPVTCLLPLGATFQSSVFACSTKRPSITRSLTRHAAACDERLLTHARKAATGREHKQSGHRGKADRPDHSGGDRTVAWARPFAKQQRCPLAHLVTRLSRVPQHRVERTALPQIERGRHRRGDRGEDAASDRKQDDRDRSRLVGVDREGERQDAWHLIEEAVREQLADAGTETEPAFASSATS